MLEFASRSVRALSRALPSPRSLALPGIVLIALMGNAGCLDRGSMSDPAPRTSALSPLDAGAPGSSDAGAASSGPTALETLFAQTFTRSTGKPNDVTAFFAIPVNVAPPFTMIVYDAIPSVRTSSATVSLNGRQLLGPSAFPLTHKRTIQLTNIGAAGKAPTGQLDVELKGKPGSSLGIVIVGTLAATTGAASGACSAIPAIENGHYFVRLRDDADVLATISDLRKLASIDVDQTYVQALRAFSASFDEPSAALIQTDPRVVAVVPSLLLATCAGVAQSAATPCPSNPGDPWSPSSGQEASLGLRRIGGSGDGQTPTRDRLGAGVRVAVIDVGVATHPDLSSQLDQGRDFVPAAGGVSAPITDSHGTMVAGIIGAADNDFGVLGVAPESRIVPVRVAARSGGDRMIEYTIGAVDWTTTNRIPLANISLGFSYITSDKTDYEANQLDLRLQIAQVPLASRQAAVQTLRDSIATMNRLSEVLDTALHDAIRASVAAGTTYVVAAGNATDLGTTTPVPVQLPQGRVFPASYDEVITVSAFEDDDGTPNGDVFWGGSNYGPAIDISAPGVEIPSTTADGQYTCGSGTSFAAPFVTGAAALYIAEHPSASPSAVRAALLADADALPLPGDPDSPQEPVLSIGKYLRVTVTGPGSGSVTTPNGEISCGAGDDACSWSFPLASDVSLSAAPIGGSHVTWDGDCASAGSASDATVHLDQDRSCTARFDCPSGQTLQDGACVARHQGCLPGQQPCAWLDGVSCGPDLCCTDRTLVYQGGEGVCTTKGPDFCVWYCQDYPQACFPGSSSGCD